MHNRIFFAVFLCKVHGLCLVFLVMQIVTWLTNNYDNERSKDSGEKPDGYTKNVLKTRFAVPELPFWDITSCKGSCICVGAVERFCFP